MQRTILLRLDWPCHSPDLDPIEKVRSMGEAHLRAAVKGPNKCVVGFALGEGIQTD